MTNIPGSIASLQAAYDNGPGINTDVGVPMSITTAAVGEDGIVVSDGTDTVSIKGNEVRLPRGTAASPALALGAGNSAGIWSPANNELVLSTNGVAALSINASQQILSGRLGGYDSYGYSFSGAPDMGMHAIADYVLAFFVLDTMVLQMRSTSIMVWAAGTQSTPAYQLSNTNAGMYKTGVSNVSFTANSKHKLTLHAELTDGALDEVAVDFTPAINKAGGAYTAFLVNTAVTAEDAGADNRLFDLQVDGGSTFWVGSAGQVNLPNVISTYVYLQDNAAQLTSGASAVGVHTATLTHAAMTGAAGDLQSVLEAVGANLRAGTLQEAYTAGNTIAATTGRPMSITTAAVGEDGITVTDGVTKAIIRGDQILAPAVAGVPGLSFTNNPNTGFSGWNSTVFYGVLNGINYYVFSTTMFGVSTRMRLPSSTAAAPGIYSNVATTSGPFWVSGGDFGISTNGVEAIRWNTAQQTLLPMGSAGSPAFAALSETAIGLYWAAARMSLSYHGNEVLRWNAVNTKGTAGTLAAPGYSFINLGGGMFVPDDNQLGLAMNSKAVIVDAATVTPAFRPDITDTWELGSAAFRWQKLYATDIDVTNFPVSSLQSSFDVGNTISTSVNRILSITTTGPGSPGLNVTDGTDTSALHGDGLEVPDGTLSAPSIYTSSARGTGLFFHPWAGSGVVGGSTAFTWGGSGLSCRRGSAGAPGFRFTSDPDNPGLYWAGLGKLGISTHNNSLAVFARSLRSATLDETSVAFTPYVEKDAGNYTALSVDVTLGVNHISPDTDSRLLSLTVDGNADSGAYITNDGRYVAASRANGSASAPNIELVPGLGLYQTGHVGYLCQSNLNALLFTAAVLRAGSNGTEATPTWGFISDPNTGVFRPATDNYAITTGGTEAIRWNAAQQTLFRAGAETAPSLSFITNPTAGIYLSGSQLAFTMGDDKIYLGLGSVANTQLFPAKDDYWVLGDPSFRWKEVWAITVNTGDLKLNSRVDDTQYTMVESADGLFLRNHTTGKSYRLLMEEVPDHTAPRTEEELARTR